MMQNLMDCFGFQGVRWISVLIGTVFVAAIAPVVAAADARAFTVDSPTIEQALFLCRVRRTGGAYRRVAGHRGVRRPRADPVAPMLEEVTRRLLDDLFALAPDRKFSGTELVAVGEHVFKHGFAVAFYDDDGDRSTVLVLRSVEKNQSKWVKRACRYLLMPDEAGPLPNPTSLRGRNLFKFGDEPEPGKAQEKQGSARADEVPSCRGVGTDSAKRLTVWLEGSDLVVVQGPDDELAGRILGTATPRKTARRGTRSGSRPCSTRSTASSRASRRTRHTKPQAHRGEISLASRPVGCSLSRRPGPGRECSRCCR